MSVQQLHLDLAHLIIVFLISFVTQLAQVRCYLGTSYLVEGEKRI